MRCDICNYRTDREDHYIRHNNTNKHYKNRYKYLKAQKEKMKDNIERIDEVIKKQLDSNIIMEYVEIKYKEPPQLKDPSEITPLIKDLNRELIVSGIDLEKEVTNYNYYMKNYNKLNIFELNDLYDELEYLKEKHIKNLDDLNNF